MKKKLLVSCVALLTMVMVSSSAFADVYETLKVKRASASTAGTLLMLETTTGSGSYAWYTAPTGQDDQALAIALTAVSLGSSLRVTKLTASSRVLLVIGLDNANL